MIKRQVRAGEAGERERKAENKMSKRKIDLECRVFKQQWTDDYFFVQCKEKAVCLICKETVAVFK